MPHAITTTASHELTAQRNEDLEEFVTFYVDGQMFGIPTLMVQDILTPDTIAPIPLAPAEVRGSINLRGRIVSVIDVRIRLGLKPLHNDDVSGMGVTVEHAAELYTLLVDRIGEVIGVPKDIYEKNPGPLDPNWRDFSAGVYRLENDLMVILNIDKLLTGLSKAA